MPNSPRKPCKHQGCPNLTADSYCEQHQPLHKNDRANAFERGYDYKWRNARLRFLKVNPLCLKCKAYGKLTKATVVDHIIPHRGDKKLFWDESNWQALCKPCHDTKTMTEDRLQEYHY